MSRRVEIILGPTAVGKSAYAIRRALEVGSPVISCDSRQIFQELKIGTAVPSDEELAAVRHYFIRSIPITRNYTAGIYEAEALDLVNRLFSEGHETLVMCGGSMLYIDAFCYGLDDFPEVPLQMREHLMECLRDEGVEVLAQQLKELDPVSFQELDLSNPQRVIRALEVCLYTGEPFSSFKTRSFKKRDFEIVKTGLERPREQLYERINARVVWRPKPAPCSRIVSSPPCKPWVTGKCSSILTESTTWTLPCATSRLLPATTPSASSPGGAGTAAFAGYRPNTFFFFGRSTPPWRQRRRRRWS